MQFAFDLYLLTLEVTMRTLQKTLIIENLLRPMPLRTFLKEYLKHLLLCTNAFVPSLLPEDSHKLVMIRFSFFKGMLKCVL